ncbi:transcriptional regulator, TetR family [Krasilnikoviella flava]|uniref:Transcriptional regulator, TetR family n=1 Tax=Krasilnikoviella flava TaxID=526729 RepID=A0A1T5LYM9_9MICO|nr:transcriptional regulator, TetR family [Krasilnikoviella flava]
MSTSHGKALRADALRNRRRALDAATALLAEPGGPPKVEAIAERAGMGAGTVVRAFGGKDALMDAAVAELLEPLVLRGRQILERDGGPTALRAFLAELMAFQAAHYAVNDQLAGLDLPATTALRAELVRVVDAMLGEGREQGAIRSDIDPVLVTSLVGETAFTIAKASHGTPELAEAYLEVLMDGLRPRVP